MCCRWKLAGKHTKNIFYFSFFLPQKLKKSSLTFIRSSHKWIQFYYQLHIHQMRKKNGLQPHRQSIRKILTECDQHQLDLRRNLKSCNLPDSINKEDSAVWLRSSNNSSESPEDYNANLTKYRYQESARKNKLLFNIQYSPLTYHSAHLIKTKSLKLDQSVVKKPRPNKIEMNSTKNIFPNLLAKFKKNRSPANASSSNKVSIYDQNKKNDEGSCLQDLAYESIKTERQKMQQMRKIMILGRIIHQNLRKGVKEISIRRNKIHKDFKL